MKKVRPSHGPHSKISTKSAAVVGETGYNTAMAFHLWQRFWRTSALEDIVVPRAGHLLRQITPVTREDSVGKAVYHMRKHGVNALPVVAGAYLVGWVTEERIARLPLEDATIVAEATEPLPGALAHETPIDELRAIFAATSQSLLPIAAPGGQYLGAVLRAEVLATHAGYVAPQRLGGMATPLGVYLSTGSASGGAGSLGLFLSGVVMGAVFWLTQVILMLAVAAGYHATELPVLLDLFYVLGYRIIGGSPIYQLSLYFLALLLIVAVFLTAFRLLPRMAGYHAAEHQTVHAIEAGEPLTVEVVKRMPRVHPRCGTNLVALLQLSYLGIAAIALALSTEIGRKNIDLVVTMALYAVIAIALSWRRVGGMIQACFTTRPASTSELESGIRAGREVLQRHLLTPQTPLRPFQRIWRMGLLQAAFGIMLAGSLLSLLDVPLDYLWHSLVK